MPPFLVELSKKSDQLTARDQMLEAIADLEEVYDSLDDIEQETVARLVEGLNRRLGDSKA